MNGSDRPTDIYETVLEFIDGGRSFALGTILDAPGSTPRNAGVKAVIDSTGKIFGTLGGGRVEAQAQQHAIEACKSGHAIVFEVNLDGTSSGSESSICGGSVRILIDPTAAKDREFYAQAAQAVRQRRPGVLLTTVRRAERVNVTLDWLEEEDISPEIGFPGAEAVRSCLKSEEARLFVRESTESHASTEVLVEPVVGKPVLLIVGGGHIGQALARQALLVGFDITVLDDRAEFTDAALFDPGVATRCGDVAKEVASFAADGDTYIVIVTRGHKLDAEALEACIHSPATYVGMLGSRRKVALIRKDFVESGLATQEQFDRVFAPIGVDIGSMTVPEIAASITAELIAVRRKGADHARRDRGERR